MEAERFYLDNHIYDKLEADPEATAALASAIEAGRIELIRTYILEDELAGAPAPVQELAARFPHRDVHVAGTILGLWRIGQARLADREDIEAIRGNTQQGNEPTPATRCTSTPHGPRARPSSPRTPAFSTSANASSWTSGAGPRSAST